MKLLITPHLDLRRDGKIKPKEEFEFGDIRANIRNRTLIVEYDGDGVPLSNLMKFWPYATNELDTSKLDIPPTPYLIICHFTDWKSWGAYRDLWYWLMDRMEILTKRRIVGRQFDIGEDDKRSENEIKRALKWIDKIATPLPSTTNS